MCSVYPSTLWKGAPRYNCEVPDTRRSVCALDCPDTCAVLVTIDGDKATKLRGDPQHPFTKGFLCAKVARYLEREYSPQRLLYPLRRTGRKGEGRFVQVSWDEALDEISIRLKRICVKYGPEAVLPYSYAGTMGLLQGAGMDRRFFHRLGASRLDRTICAATGNAGLTEALGFRYGTDPEQFRHAKLIVAWGANIHGTNVHLWPFIAEARRNGAKLYTIDPVTTRTATLADKHFPLYPGSDLALALGMIHVLIGEGLTDADYIARHTSGFDSLKKRAAEYPPEKVEALTGIPKREIVELARDYGSLRPAAIRLNFGMQRSERGGKATRVIALLPALTGSWKEPGGGLFLSTSQAFVFNRAGLEMPDLQMKSLGREARLVNMSELGKVLTELKEPPVMGLVVYNSNPGAIAPNLNLVRAGLRRLDLFTVVMEHFQTDTADYADFVLPATTWLEHTDLYYAYGHYYLQMARPALDAPAETKSNLEIFRLLAKRMGFDDGCFDETEDDMMRTALDSGHAHMDGITLERLERERSIRLNLSPAGAPFLPFAEGGFGTADGKCDLRAETLAYTPPVESRLGDKWLRRSYPLELVSSKNDNSLSSTFGFRSDVDRQTAVLAMHWDDAEQRDIVTGDTVRVFNGRGSCLLTARVDGSVRPGVVRAPSVRWAKKALDRQNSNVLTSDRLTDIGGGPVFHSCLVQVEKCAE